MTQTTVTVNGVEMISVVPQSTHVNIHIHQKPAWEQLLKAMGSLKFLPCFQDAGPSKASIHHGQLALGAIVAGASIIVHEKQQGKLSGHISRLLILACIATAVAATVLGMSSLIWQTSAFYHVKISSTCDSSQSSMGSGYGIVRFNDDSVWKTERCKEYLNMMMNLFLAICIMFTVVCILKIVVSLASLGLSLQSMCGQSSQALDEEETEKKLLGGDSTPPSPTKEIPGIL